MTLDEARERIVSGIDCAAYHETDCSLYDANKNRLFGSEHYNSGRLTQRSSHGRKAISRRKWPRYFVGPISLASPILRSRKLRDFWKQKILS